MSSERAIEKITVDFDNGEKSEITKGFIVGFKDDEIEDKREITFHMCNISGGELRDVFLSVLKFADKMGFFDDNADENDQIDDDDEWDD